MALTMLVTIYVMTLKQIEAESVIHPAVAIAILSVHLATFMAQTLQEHCQTSTTNGPATTITITETPTHKNQHRHKKNELVVAQP